MNTRCPPKRVPSAARFFTRCRLTVQPPQSYSVGGQRSSGQLTGKPAGARPDHRGRWCELYLGSAYRYHPCADSGSNEDEHTLSSEACAVSRPLLFNLQARHAANPELQRRRTMQISTPVVWPGTCGLACKLPGQTTGVEDTLAQVTLCQLCAAPWELPSTVGCGIAWTRTSNIQAIGRILHSTRSTFTGCATREPHDKVNS
ncbi:UNVERIFIED_CONTAM: hypothetical protein FKN15_069218 [Acipenser sinensis]